MPPERKKRPASDLHLSSAEILVARALQGDIPLTDHPFKVIAERVGLTEETVLEIVQGFRERGLFRKFSAILRHQLAGYIHNLMVLWAVPPARCEEVGKILSSFPEVTHCYERTPPFAGHYNLFTMVHFRGEEEVPFDRMARAAAIEDFRILRSIEEFKKSSMEYF